MGERRVGAVSSATAGNSNIGEHGGLTKSASVVVLYGSCRLAQPLTGAGGRFGQGAQCVVSSLASLIETLPAGPGAAIQVYCELRHCAEQQRRAEYCDFCLLGQRQGWCELAELAFATR